jgi:hypothetical protein
VTDKPIDQYTIEGKLRYRHRLQRIGRHLVH